MADDTPATPADNESQKPEPETQPATTGQDPAATPDAPSLTQADVDRIVKERLKRDRQAQESKRLEELGIESFDDLKSMMEDYRKRKEADMSELEKAQAKIEAAEKKAQEAEHRAQTLQAEHLAARRREVFLKAVRENGGRDEDDLYILVTAKHGEDFNSVFIEADAKPDDEKLKAFIKQVQSAHSAYFGTPGGGSPSNAGGQTPRSSGLTPETQKAIRQKHGRL